MLAHHAGGYATGTDYKEMIRQGKNRPKPGQLTEDAINDFQLKERADKTPNELIAFPHTHAEKLSMKHLMWVIHSRDTWMHRLDICRATGHEFEQTHEHDGRIAELVMLDVAETRVRKFDDPALVFELTGIAGGAWKFSKGKPAATICMDVLEFNIFASGCYTYEEARPMATITGDVAAVEEALKNILVVYSTMNTKGLP
jgi:hypothetical protein